MNYFLAFGAAVLYVALRAIQQRHVQHAEYWRMPLVSYGMAVCDVFVVSLVVKQSDSLAGLAVLAFATGSGGALGSILGTWLHARKH
jgi:hypothetical protein